MTAHGGEDTDTLRASEVEIVLGQGLVLVGGRPMPLSVREFNLLAALVRRPGAVATRHELYAEAWGSELRPGDRQVDVYVAKLRRKLAKLVVAGVKHLQAAQRPELLRQLPKGVVAEVEDAQTAQLADARR